MKVSKKLLDMLTEFFVNEIQSRVLDGVTYCFLLKHNKKDMKYLENYKEIKKEIINCGFEDGNIFAYLK